MVDDFDGDTMGKIESSAFNSVTGCVAKTRLLFADVSCNFKFWFSCSKERLSKDGHCIISCWSSASLEVENLSKAFLAADKFEFFSAEGPPRAFMRVLSLTRPEIEASREEVLSISLVALLGASVGVSEAPFMVSVVCSSRTFISTVCPVTVRTNDSKHVEKLFST